MAPTALILAALTALAARAHAGEISVAGLDARVELGEIAYWLSARPKLGDLVTPVAKAYYEDAVKHFKAAAKHPAAALSAEIVPAEAPTPEESAVYRIRTELGAAPGGLPADAARKWLDALADFSKTARFEEFYAKRALRFDPPLKIFRERFKREDYLKPLEDYAGLKLRGRLRIIFSPSLEILAAGRGDTVHLPGEGGSVLIETVFTTLLLDDLGTAGLPEDVPVTLWHELGHALIDPLCDKHWKKIEAKRGENILPAEWEAYAKDLFVQAVVVRLFARKNGEQAGLRQMSFEEEPERRHLEALTAALKRYEAGRKSYPTLADFFGEYVAALP